MAVIIPLHPNEPHYSLEVELDEIAYGLELRWNERDEAWFLTVSDSSQNVLVAGRKIVVELPLLNRFKDPRLPAGVLVATDTAGTMLDATLEDFGTRVLLVYLSLDELTA